MCTAPVTRPQYLTNSDCHEVRAMEVDALRLPSPGDASWQLHCTGGVYMVDLPMDEVTKRYEDGESTTQLASAYGVCCPTINRRLHAAGVKLRPCGARPGNQYRLGHYRRGGPLFIDAGRYLRTYGREGKKQYIHRACWEAYNGPIPSGHVVHHIDGDPLNNGIENLACILQGEHTRLHRAGRRKKR